MLRIEDLRINYKTKLGMVRAVDGVDLYLDRGEFLGLAGESGCGKSTVAMSILRILPDNAEIANGKILLNGNDLLKMSEKEFRNIRWNKVSMIFQSSMNALNPVMRINDQIAEALIIHKGLTKSDASKKVTELLSMVNVEPSKAVAYPHELSGGMKQRVVIAMALSCNPDLLLADEPTTALDTMTQIQILELLKNLKRELNLTMIIISHDLAIMAELCTKIAIMYAGKIVEISDLKPIYGSPLHPYTRKLINSVPSLRGEKKKLESIPGSLPDPMNLPKGCRFYPRCDLAMDICQNEEPNLCEVRKDHYVACYAI